MRAKLAGDFSFDRIEVARVLGSADTTRKFLFRLSDGNLIQFRCVASLPGTLRVAVGFGGQFAFQLRLVAPTAANFAQAGSDGWKRNLRPNEIVNQIIAVERESEERIDNIVFMGMGEPLANYDSVMGAIQIINAPWGIGIGARHITISTSGLVPQIRKLAEQPLQIRLAVSLHGATDGVRSGIMPVNRKYNLSALLEACRYFTSRKKQRITFEYILIAEVNDSDKQARELAKHAHALDAKLNLIPYNNVEGLDWVAHLPVGRKDFLPFSVPPECALRCAGKRVTISLRLVDNCVCRRSAQS